MTGFYGRVVADDDTQRLLDNGWYDANPGKGAKGASGGWWRKGALVVDGEGPGIVDAEGVRHSLPLPSSGGQLVLAYVQSAWVGYSSGRLNYRVFVADANDRLVCHLPDEGVTEELAQSFAEAAGLRFVLDKKTLNWDQLKRRYGDIFGEDDYSNLRWTRADFEYGIKDRIRRLFGKK